MINSTVLKTPGSWSPNGYRVGPAPGMFRERPEVGNYGAGMPYGTLYSYVIKPVPVVAQNVVTTTTLTAQPQWVPLNESSTGADTVVSFYYGDGPIPYGSSPSDLPPQMQDGQILTLQFQYPCAVTLTTSNAITGSNFIIYGYDWYGQPMQVSSQTVSNTTTAAFYGITGVWYKGTLAAATTVSISTTQTYGLPFCINSKTQLVAYSETGDTPGVIVPAISPAGVSASGDAPDVRGTVSASTVDGDTESLTTYYVEGADPQQATLYAMSLGQNPSGLPFSFASGSPLTFSELIGEPPAYRGHP